MEIFWLCVVTVLAVVGLSELIRALAYSICRSAAPKDTAVMMIPIEGNCAQAEYILRSAAQQMRCGKRNAVRKIVVVLVNTGEETEKICRALCREYSFMEIEKRETMPEALK